MPAGTSWNPNGMRQILGPPGTCLLTPSVSSQHERARDEQHYRTIHKVADHDAGGDEDLEHTGDATTHFLGCAFRYVGRCDGRNGTDSEARDDTSSIDVADPSRTAGDGGEDLRGGSQVKDSAKETH